MYKPYDPVDREGMTVTADDIQIKGDHYKQFKGHEPWNVIIAWGLGYLDGTAVKYLSRWRHKGGVDDLKKAAHFIQKLIEEEEKHGSLGTVGRT